MSGLSVSVLALASFLQSAVLVATAATVGLWASRRAGFRAPVIDRLLTSAQTSSCTCWLPGSSPLDVKSADGLRVIQKKRGN